MSNDQESCVIKLITGKSNSYSSDVFKGIIGQKSAINQIKFYAASHSSIKPFPTVLLQGGHGLGKTYLSRKIAESLGRRFIEINSETILSKESFVEDIILNRILGDDAVTVLFDEAHGLPKQVASMLLTILSPNNLHKNIISFVNYNMEWDLGKINTIFATNDHCKIPVALRNRCFPIILSPYSNNELIDIIKLYLPKDIKITANEDEIAYACRGRARGAFMVSEDIGRECNINNTKVFDDTKWEYLKEIIYRFPLGLNEQEVEMMEIIKEESPISAYNLSTKMMVEEDTITKDYEIRPRELGLMANTGKGRVLTAKGIEYLDKLLVTEG